MDIKVLASGSDGNCYLISDGKSKLLLDAGINMDRIMKGCQFMLSSINGCLITHEHGDHSKSAQKLANMAIDVYASKGTATACKLKGHRVKTVKAFNGDEDVNSQFYDIGTFKVLPFKIQHDAAEPLGFYIISNITGERLLYMTDTYYVEYKFSGLTHILMEINYSPEAVEHNVRHGYVPEVYAKRVFKSHMSIDNAIEFLRANDLRNLRKVYIIHMSKHNAQADEFKRRVQEVTGCAVELAE